MFLGLSFLQLSAVELLFDRSSSAREAERIVLLAAAATTRIDYEERNAAFSATRF